MQELDWPTITSGLGVFLTTVFLTYKGWQDRKKELAKPEPAQLVAGVIQDNSSIRENTLAIQALTAEIKRQNDIAMLTAAIRRIDEH